MWRSSGKKLVIPESCVSGLSGIATDANAYPIPGQRRFAASPGDDNGKKGAGYHPFFAFNRSTLRA